MAAAIRLTIILFPYNLADYEPYRGMSVELTGTVCGMEQKLEGDSIVWRMMLSDIRTDDIAESAEYCPINPGKRGRVLCVLDHAPEADFSARVCLRGTLYPFRNAMNEGEFDLRMYYHILRVSFSLRDVDIRAASAPTDKLGALLFHFKNLKKTILTCK